MKISIECGAFLRSLNHVQGVVERRNTIPILSNVMLRADKGALTLTTTDMDLELTESVAANVAKPGATTVPAHTLHDIARKLPNDSMVEITVNPEGTQMAVKAGRSQFKLGCLPTADFPALGAGDLPSGFAIAAADLRALIDRTRFAMSTEETRYYLNGIYLHEAESNGVNVLRAVATDGHRLARFEMPLPEGAQGMPGVIVPRKTVTELRKLIEDAADSIHVTLSKTKIQFAFDHVVLTSKLIDGTFPDYQRVIPQNNSKTVELDPGIFTRAVDRVSTIADGKSRAVKITLQGKTLVISANSPESGSATEEMEVNSTADIEIGFNARYVLDITGQLKGEGCRMSFSDPASPTIIQDNSDPSSLYVLMPLRV